MSKYKVLKIGNHLYYEHRVVFYNHRGYMPKCVDHVNGIKDDNRIENLRDATTSQNMLNVGKYCTNTSGYKGVSWCKRTGLWQVAISVNSKLRAFGRHKDLELAGFIASEARKHYHGPYAHD